MSRSPGNPVTLTFDLWSWEVLFCKIVFSHVKPRNMIAIFAFISKRVAFELLLLKPTSLKQEYRWSYSKSSSNITDGFNVVKMVSCYMICQISLIFEVKLKLSCAKRWLWNYRNGFNSYLWGSFKPTPKMKVNFYLVNGIVPAVHSPYLGWVA